MTRVRDVAFGAILGAICTGVIASLAAAPPVDPGSPTQPTRIRFPMDQLPLAA